MGLFDRKPRISTQDFCDDFYSKYVFAPPIGDANPWRLFCDSARQLVLKADPAFSAVDASGLRDQLLALRLEVVGIAWMLHVKDRLSPRQSECTRVYLSRHDRDDLWDMMEPYNQATAKSTVGRSDASTRAGRAHITFLNSMRTQLFDEWVATVSDPKDAARAANRIGCNWPWQSKKTHIYLSFALTDQLLCEINEEARMAIMAIIQGFHDGVCEELLKVKIVS